MWYSDRVKTTLTDKQRALFEFIETHQRDKGYPPTIREIGRAFGFRSTGTVRDHLRAIVAKGYLKKLRRKSRGVMPLAWPGALRGQWPALPILGRVPAGGPLLVEENVEGTVDLSREFGGENVFALKVRGDSMVEAGVCDGDLVVVRAQEVADNGQIVVALVDGEATVKRLSRRGSRLWLAPANARYEPIPVGGDTKIIGRVIGVIRSYERKW